MNPHDALEYVDENTIGVMVILGSTYTGHFEDVHLMSDLCRLSFNQVRLIQLTKEISQWTILRSALDLIFPYTLTRHLGDSLLLSPIPISNGLLMSSESSPSTHLDINLVLSMLGSAGSFGETKVSFTRIWSLNCVSRHTPDISNLSNGHVKFRLSGQY